MVSGTVKKLSRSKATNDSFQRELVNVKLIKQKGEHPNIVYVEKIGKDCYDMECLYITLAEALDFTTLVWNPLDETDNTNTTPIIQLPLPVVTEL